MHGPGGSKSSSSSIACDISFGFSTIGRLWSGCSYSVLPIQPISRLVVSLPAPATTLTIALISSRVSLRVVPLGSLKSALSNSVIMSSDGFFSRHLMYSSKLSSRSEEHTSELQTLMHISYAVFCLKQKINYNL